MPWNVPDDWNQYYYSCGCHASEGGCSCPRAAEDSERPWLEESGYDYDGYETWEKLISFSTHTCRRDHSDGKIKKGERYKVWVYRCVDDEDGSSWHYKKKSKIVPANIR